MRTTFITLLLTVLLTSCFHVYYAPNTVSAPLLTEKGEVKINGLYTYGGNSEFEGGELQCAYAFKNNWGLMLNGMAAGNNQTDDFYDKGHGSYLEVGAGYFSRFDPTTKWMYECYGGIGFGSITNEYQNFSPSKVGVTKIFIQPSIGFKSRHFEFAFVPRMGYVNWNVKQDATGQGSSDKEELDYIRNKSGFFAFEPGIVLRAGGQGIKFQTGFTLIPTHPYIFDMMETNNLHFGVSINLGGKKKTEHQENTLK